MVYGVPGEVFGYLSHAVRREPDGCTGAISGRYAMGERRCPVSGESPINFRYLGGKYEPVGRYKQIKGGIYVCRNSGLVF